MAFSTGAKAIEGPEVPEIQTDVLGLRALNGDKRARIVSASWPSDNPPPSYASLLSIASAHGLFAAAGPSQLVIGETQGARDVIYKNDVEDVRDYSGTFSIPHDRLAHVAFSASQNCLVVAEQNAHSLTVYSTASLKSKDSTPALRLDTKAPLRILSPNPDPGQAQYLALVTTNGELLIADLSTSQLVSGVNGTTIAENASCVCWSNKGKQLIVGRGDGTALQIKPDGSLVAEIPRPSSVPANCFVDQIAWIDNDSFFFIFTPAVTNADDGLPVSEYYIVTRVKPDFEFRKAPEIVFPTAERLPAHFFISRLRKYEPHLDEVVVVSSTVGSDVRILSKSSQPLTDQPDTQNVFTLTMPDNDQGLAALPLSENGDTTAIGMAVDLSDKDYIINPIPNEPDIDKTSGPIPLVAALNNEGVLSIWAVIYHDAIRQKVQYSSFAGLNSILQLSSGSEPTRSVSSGTTMDTSIPAAEEKPQQVSLNTPSPFSTQKLSFPTTQSSSFGSGNSFPKSAPLGASSTPSWTSQGFGSGPPQAPAAAANPAFGTPASLGSTGQKPGFGQGPTFGQSSLAGAPAFGQTGFANKGPAAFGQTGFASRTNPPTQQSPFGATAVSKDSPFGAFANKGGFGSADAQQKQNSPFTSKASDANTFGKSPLTGANTFGQNPSPFGQTASNNSSGFAQGSSGKSNGFGQPSSPFVFKPDSTQNSSSDSSAPGKNIFGNPSQPFKLESSFKGDGSAKDDLPMPTGSSSFGFGGLGSMLDDAKPGQKASFSREEEMNDSAGSSTEIEQEKPSTKTPPATITQSKKTTTPPVSSLFGTTKLQSTTPAEKPPTSSGFTFGQLPSTTPKDTPGPTSSIYGTSKGLDTTPVAAQRGGSVKHASTDAIQQATAAPEIKHEPASDDEGISMAKIPEAPLPPDPFSKPGYQAGDTSASSLGSVLPEPNDAPLPPDFLPANKSASRGLSTEESELPSVDFSDDLEGSGEEITGDVSPVETGNEEDRVGADVANEQIQTSPESSFGRGEGSLDESPMGGPFTKVSTIEQPKPTRPLFGELGSTGPTFAPPKPQESPRSPSPVRKHALHEYLRSPERSVSAPARPRSIIEQRKLEHQKSTFAAHAAQIRAEEEERERARIAAQHQAQLEADRLAQQPLVDDEDAILQEELAKEIEPTPTLDPFVTIQPGKALQESDKGRTDIPSQIEKLYQDINSMVVTLGINVRSLQSFMQYQAEQPPNPNWPAVLTSETPGDALVDEWYLGDIGRLPEGYRLLDRAVGDAQVHNATAKLDRCQELLNNEITSLRTRLMGLRKTMHSRNQPESSAHAPLSAEQLSIQQDLRRASTSVQNKLAQLEDNLGVLRAKLVEVAPQTGLKSTTMMGKSGAAKKPTVEAVMNTVSKMTSQAEKKSADVDVLEAQLRKLGVTSSSQTNGRPVTPDGQRLGASTRTPGSGRSSVFYTPDSRSGRSRAGTPAKAGLAMLSDTDRERSRTKAQKRSEIASTLKAVLEEKQRKARASR